jgi:uncharacterized tellurite resistance protein B-like protein|tara:strand:+ start:131 stop:574 length:444 start_codon:yes stop_codon:yes gene_type:complete
MVKFIKNFFSSKKENPIYDDDLDLNLAIIVILLRASSIDGNKDDIELNMIKDIAQKELNIEKEVLESLYTKAIEEEDFTADIYKYTKIINDNFEENDKLNILKLVCKIINVDKNIDPFESNFVRRLSGLLYITDRQAGEIKKEFLDS